MPEPAPFRTFPIKTWREVKIPLKLMTARIEQDLASGAIEITRFGSEESQRSQKEDPSPSDARFLSCLFDFLLSERRNYTQTTSYDLTILLTLTGFFKIGTRK